MMEEGCLKVTEAKKSLISITSQKISSISGLIGESDWFSHRRLFAIRTLLNVRCS